MLGKIDDNCPTLLPQINILHFNYVIFEGQCMLKDGHGEDDHLIFICHPMGQSGEFHLWTKDRENDDGTDEDFQDYLSHEISVDEARELLKKSWGRRADRVIGEIEVEITRECQ